MVSAVLGVPHQLAGHRWQPIDDSTPAVGFDEGIDRLDAYTVALLGPEPAERGVRIMVAAPSDRVEPPRRRPMPRCRHPAVGSRRLASGSASRSPTIAT